MINCRFFKDRSLVERLFGENKIQVRYCFILYQTTRFVELSLFFVVRFRSWFQLLRWRGA